MKLTVALSVVFILAIGVTLASPLGNQHHHHGNADEQTHLHRATPRTPELYELMGFPDMLVNDTFENDTQGTTQNFEHILNEGFIPINVSQTPKTELPENPNPLEPQNATRTVESLETHHHTKTSRREYRSNNSVAYANDLEDDVQNYTSIHGNCSHCMEDIENTTSIKYVGCMCSLFTTIHPTVLDSPLSSKIFPNVPCDHRVPGEVACTKQCIIMATLYKEVDDDILCLFIQNASRITVYLQSKLCEDDSRWTFTGVSTVTPVCCHMGKTVSC